VFCGPPNAVLPFGGAGDLIFDDVCGHRAWGQVCEGRYATCSTTLVSRLHNVDFYVVWTLCGEGFFAVCDMENTTNKSAKWGFYASDSSIHFRSSFELREKAGIGNVATCRF
jgi:hypothetical protein